MAKQLPVVKSTNVKSAIENVCLNHKQLVIQFGPANKQFGWCWMVIVSAKAARRLDVAPQSVANWLREYADSLWATLSGPDKPVQVAEQDELFTFIGEKKTKSTS